MNKQPLFEMRVNKAMKKRKLGNTGIQTSAIGLGAMSFYQFLWTLQ